MRVTAHQSSWQRYIREANAGKSIALQMPRRVQVSEKVSNQTILNRHQSRLKTLRHSAHRSDRNVGWDRSQ